MSPSQWRYAHNYRHHVFTNVIGMDDDPDTVCCGSPATSNGGSVTCCSRCETCCWPSCSNGHRIAGLALGASSGSDRRRETAQTRGLIRKFARQVGKDYLFFPALSLRRWRCTLTANVVANLLRNVWAYLVICCGHFPDGAEKFIPAALEGETKPEWYLRQMLGTANFRAGPVLPQRQPVLPDRTPPFP